MRTKRKQRRLREQRLVALAKVWFICVCLDYEGALRDLDVEELAAHFRSQQELDELEERYAYLDTGPDSWEDEERERRWRDVVETNTEELFGPDSQRAQFEEYALWESCWRAFPHYGDCEDDCTCAACCDVYDFFLYAEGSYSEQFYAEQHEPHKRAPRQVCRAHMTQIRDWYNQ